MPLDSHHVIPDQNGGWKVKKSGTERASKRFDLKKDAIEFAKRLCKNQNTELIVHKKNGSIEKRNTIRY